MAGNNNDIFNRLNRQGEVLARIDERTERMDKEWKEHRNDHETRIRKLEFANEKRKGIAAGIGAVAGVIVQGVIEFFKHLAGGN